MSVKPIKIQNALTVNYCKNYVIISDLWPTISTQKSNPSHFETSYKLTYYSVYYIHRDTLITPPSIQTSVKFVLFNLYKKNQIL